MGFIVCKMEPRGPLHLGIKETILEETSDHIHSDTLFSAICNAHRLLYGNEELEKLLQQFKGKTPPFLISSAFPYINETLLLPVPKSVDFGEYSEDKKRFKKVRFVSKDIFDQIVRGETVKESVKEGNLLQSGQILLTSGEKSRIEDTRIWSEEEIPRVVIDRKTSASNIYHFGQVMYSERCGMYFLIDSRDGEYVERLKAAMRLLGDEGMGGDRTYGKGLFKIKKPEFDTVSMDLTPRGHFTTLSLYHPTKEEIPILKNGRYELVGRGGWIYSLEGRNMRRRFIRMFAEGSVFPAPADLYGDLVSVKPKEFTDHEIYRYGYAFAIPLEVKG